MALTGTPIENSLRDLWSICHFVIPGVSGSRKSFAERFEKPLRDGGEPGLARRLALRIATHFEAAFEIGGGPGFAGAH